MAVEINTSGLTHGANEMYCSPDILRWMAERDIPILFGSDAHRPRDIARYFPEALALARTSGITHRAEYRGRKLTRVPL
jgi:histidinol-phosphatase (PHP family)